MKRIQQCLAILLSVAALAAVAAFLAGWHFGGGVKPSEEAAVKRAQEFAQAVNYDYAHPEKAYAYLTEEFRSRMSEEEFIQAFRKERGYPYLTPFFINYESIEMNGDNLGGTAVFSQAARLPGMVYRLPFVYENGNYYVIAFEDFPDGSYLEKFDKL